MKYRVIWFDDQYPELDWVKESADLNDIELIGFTNATEGIQELEANILMYDGAIVDGLFYQRADQAGKVDSTLALGDVARALDRLRSIKALPWFVFSGKDKITKQDNELVQLFRAGRRYDKTLESDLLQLWHDLKVEAAQQPETQLRQKYARVFHASQCSASTNQIENTLLSALLLAEKAPETGVETKEYFNALRKIIECIFQDLNKLGVIPDPVFEDKGWINGCSRYLSGKHERFKISEGLIPGAISFLIWQLIQIFQDSSHAISEKLNQAFDEFISTHKTPYLFRSSLFMLLDVIIWLDAFSQKISHEAPEEKYWMEEANHQITSENWIIGTIVQVASNGYGTFAPEKGNFTVTILPAIMQKHFLNLHQKITITTKPGKDPHKPFLDKISLP
jgi:hypothetical protein